ncbi:MAG TPA: S8 family serine peptidase [Anaerolineae bacterium]|nr:S8 family serine peptidase [Anaerolineae bacterium]HQI85531.1 S8 family serine peptidase [Anaerolineae bacterium]
MKHKWLYFIVWAMLLLGFLPGSTPVVSAPEPPVGVTVDPELQYQIQTDEATGYLIYFREQADLSPAYALDWQARGRFVVEALQATAEAAQQSVRAYLDAQGVPYQAFWVDNVIVVEASTLTTFNALTMAFPEVEALRARQHPVLYEPEEVKPGAEPLAVESNLVRVKANQVWALGYTGQGIVVANIDTGVRYTHRALVNQYRGRLDAVTFDHNYNWWDPYLRSPAPNGSGSAANHGSHTMGTMVGDDGGVNQIGVAPGARWIACKTFEGGNTDAQLLECGQFMVAPWDLTGANANPDLRPHIVNNSWGNCDQTYNSWYAGVINAWHAAGIYPVFSNGNNTNCSYPAPPGLNTVGNPARSGNVTAVGSTSKDTGTYATHSNWGPTDNPDTVNPRGYPDLKPQVVAPGVSIRSAYATGDTVYGSMTGTSMSAPHVSGLVALMWSAAPCLIGNYTATETIIEETATPIYYNDLGTGARWPNYATGWGEINALAAVELAIVACKDGSLVGQMTDASAATPIPNARVEASSAARPPRVTFTDAAGMYALKLHSGVYTLTVSAYGYQTTVVPGVEHTVGFTTTRNVTLTPFAWYTVTGYVTDSAAGWPLYARIRANGNAATDTWTDPVTGYYSLALPSGATHTLAVAAWAAGYLPKTITLPPLTGDMTQNVGLAVDTTICRAPGYRFTGTFVEENFDALTPPALGGWATVIVSGANPAWATREGTRYPSGQPAHTAPNLVFFNSYSVVSGGSARLYRTQGINMTTLPAHWLTWWMYHDRGYSTLNDRVQVQVSTDGGTSWVNVGAAVPRYDGSTGWKLHQLDLSAYNTQTDLRVGFLGISAYGNDIHLDDIFIGQQPTCSGPAVGGLVVGNVYADDTHTPLAGAQVASAAAQAQARATDDPAVDDGFYTLFAPAGAQPLTATLALYGLDTATVTVVMSHTTWQDFYLPSGRLTITPTALHTVLELGATDALSLTLENVGAWPAAWQIAESAPWLSASPVTDTLAAGHTQSVTVAFDAGALPLAQPGEYATALWVYHDTPSSALRVPVTMTVVPPSAYGKLTGVVTGLGDCDAHPAPLANANIVITNQLGVTWTLQTDAAGVYQRWLATSGSPFTVTASAVGHTSGLQSGIFVQDGLTTTADFNLRRLQPCVTVAPTTLAAALLPNRQYTTTLRIVNTGAATATFRLRERWAGFTPTAVGGPDPFGYQWADSNAADGPAYQWIDIAATGALVTGLSDDNFQGPFALGFDFPFYGVTQTQFYVGSNGLLTFGAGSAAYDNQCPLPTATTPNQLIALLWDDLDFKTGGAAYYQTFAACPYGANTGSCAIVQVNDATYYGSPVGSAGDWQAILFASGNILIQFQDAGRAGLGSTTGIEDAAGARGLTYAAAGSCNVAGSIQDESAVCFAYPGQQTNCLPADPLVWLREDPITGDIAADGQAAVAVTFDSGAVSTAGDYAATLWLTHNSSTGDIVIPVSLTVAPAGAYTAIAAGAWSDSNVWRDHLSTPPTVSDDVLITAGAAITVNAPAVCANFAIEYGATLTIPDGFTLTVEATAINSGTLTHSRAVAGGAPVALGHLLNSGGTPVYHGVVLASAAEMGLVTATIRGRQACTTAGAGDTVNRCFNITPAIVPTDGVTLTFYFAASEIPTGQACETMEVYHHNGTTWSAPLARDMAYGVDGRDCSAEPYSIRVVGVADFSPFVLKSGSAPNAVRTLTASALSLWDFAPLLALLGAAALSRAERRLRSAPLSPGARCAAAEAEMPRGHTRPRDGGGERALKRRAATVLCAPGDGGALRGGGGGNAARLYPPPRRGRRACAEAQSGDCALRPRPRGRVVRRQRRKCRAAIPAPETGAVSVR